MRQICTHCGSSEIEFDAAQGNSVCTSCGTVLEENTIVSEVTFAETTAGTSVLQGQFVSDKGVAPPTMFGFQKRYPQTDSREWTIANARMKIQNLAHAMQLSDHHIESAHRWFILSLQHNFTRGRKSQNIAAACLYIVCRQEKTPHMLLDFSDVLRTNVYELGNMFLKLCRLLGLDLPLIDPSLYIGRFASKLEFGENTSIVANTALRLVSRMKRDWIQTGRRPAGICGACLLISARLHGFKRTQKQIIHIVRICDMTLRNRLNEFGETPSSQLTSEDFHGVWLEQEEDPPAFTRNKNKIQERTEELDHINIVIPSLDTDNLEDMDTDKEILNAFLDEKEIELKTKLWMNENKDYLIVQEEKIRLLKEQEAMGLVKPITKKRKKRERQTNETTPSIEISKQILQVKKISKKFNYEVLDSLLGDKSVQSVANRIQREVEK